MGIGRLGLWRNNNYGGGKTPGYCKYNHIIYCLVQGKERLESTFETGFLQKWKYLFSSSTKWPYWVVSWEAVSSHHMTLIAVSVFVRVWMLMCAERSRVCVSGHQTELQGLRQETAARWISSELHRAYVKEEILPPTLLPLKQDRPLHVVFQTVACR